ncbi:MAG: hypothetical protein E5Y63_30175 [Mesorhizobium sp.]|uniref:Peptidase M4 n=2 Tax=Mesorhizobium TaxID=68287 RepID=A0A1G9K4M3_9HYPH|nr:MULTISPECIES: hypothetical protein [Mesorhizobium]AZO19683.1 hypothetical protein EJ070_02655 [Mesorhizobium sp. M1E.F.Ca.ET.045.02.1.1]MCF6100663.1 hypothetical protein [Mesorhizobium muleiense]RUV07339.1 hypothetical protein EOA79_05075 [Mesorhizobium sp. M1A.F.Ca.IN.020.03.2.1]RUV68299.1 hypothetical protein EOA78_27285 [Mesorhizobium sp. M5C.F.Cr.IN.023.01.1.1]RUV86849.1 hypothetical protein EOA51_13245 [Mesorhizobium sp. M1A.F.Ca.IN.020.32.1.1]
MSGQYTAPPVRRLRVYAFDPQASTSAATAGVNVATIKIPWEQSWEEEIQPGPINDYLEVIDIDPVSGQFYEPVDLNHPYLLAQDGLAPSEGDPRFHQQMVFAVAMKTIRTFERALGRRVFWAPRRVPNGRKYEPVYKLRIYPHALREPNAYYSREKKALLFGYFQTSAHSAGAKWVFTALSHDIIVHEVTHAILDGLHRRFAEPTSVDSLAFHEAFADIVALFSHFSLEEAVSAQIAKDGGSLDNRSLLSGLARQFGEATGRDGALREAIDDHSGAAPVILRDDMTEPHERGAVLVAAVFDAFLSIYENRTADLLRIAGIRPGIGPDQNLHPDLVKRLTREASKAAEHVMRMCIRALDYLPPVDVRFGDFLRAIITADYDLVPDDVLNYRLAIIEGFRRRGIIPEGCLSLAVDSLLWEAPVHHLAADYDDLDLDLEPKFDRTTAIKAAEENAESVHWWILGSESFRTTEDKPWQEVCGVVFRRGLISYDDRETILSRPGDPKGFAPPVEIHSVRTSRRTGPDGQDLRQLIIEIVQQRRGFYDQNEQELQDKHGDNPSGADFVFRGGATLIFDLREGHLRYAVRKRISDDARLEQQRDFLAGYRFGSTAFGYGLQGGSTGTALDEPFALVHRGG